MKQTNITHLSSKLAKEHKLIIDYIIKFNNELTLKDKKFFSELESFLTFLENDLQQHFKTEELIFFPVAILCREKKDSAQMIKELENDHSDIISQLQKVAAEYRDLKQTKKSGKAFLKNAIHFFEKLKTHCRHEMTTLYPMLDESEFCKEMLIQYTEEINNKRTQTPES